MVQHSPSATWPVGGTAWVMDVEGADPTNFPTNKARISGLPLAACSGLRQGAPQNDAGAGVGADVLGDLLRGLAGKVLDRLGALGAVQAAIRHRLEEQPGLFAQGTGMTYRRESHRTPTSKSSGGMTMPSRMSSRGQIGASGFMIWHRVEP